MLQEFLNIMNDKKEYLVETDILVEHLTNADGNKSSYLEELMQDGICFTTVLNASELNFAVKNEDELEVVNKVLASIKVIGLSSRYSLMVSKFNEKVSNYRDALVCAIADINKLPIVSLNDARYIKSGLKVINPKELRG